MAPEPVGNPPESDVIDEKRQPGYRLTRYSIPWLILLPLIGYELVMVQQGRMGGPLSHVVWWAYGERWSLRWWLLACSMAGFFAWVVWHFAMETPALRELGILVGAGLLIGLLGWLIR
jgi:hypothetical protein